MKHCFIDRETDAACCGRRREINTLIRDCRHSAAARQSQAQRRPDGITAIDTV
jgi:hypothetical protein